MKLHTNFFEDSQNDKKKIEDFGTSKYQNKRPLKFLEEKQIAPLPPLQNFTQKFLKTHKMTRKIENFEISK